LENLNAAKKQSDELVMLVARYRVEPLVIYPFITVLLRASVLIKVIPVAETDTVVHVHA